MNVVHLLCFPSDLYHLYDMTAFTIWLPKQKPNRHQRLMFSLASFVGMRSVFRCQVANSTFYRSSQDRADLALPGRLSSSGYRVRLNAERTPRMSGDFRLLLLAGHSGNGSAASCATLFVYRQRLRMAGGYHSLIYSITSGSRFGEVILSTIPTSTSHMLFRSLGSASTWPTARRWRWR
jgi:hypothetical protein